MMESKEESPKKRVLVVNDDPVQLAMVETTLGKMDLDVVAARHGGEALGKVSDDREPNLVITDLYMPSVDGWALCRELRRSPLPYLARVPILILSSTFGGAEAQRIIKELDANGFLSFPYSPRELKHTVENLIFGRGSVQKKRALVIVDSEIQRRRIVDSLENHGYHIFEGADGATGLELFSRAAPELVILS